MHFDRWPCTNIHTVELHRTSQVSPPLAKTQPKFGCLYDVWPGNGWDTFVQFLNTYLPFHVQRLSVKNQLTKACMSSVHLLAELHSHNMSLDIFTKHSEDIFISLNVGEWTGEYHANAVQTGPCKWCSHFVNASKAALVPLLTWSFLLVVCSNHSPKMHYVWAMCIGLQRTVISDCSIA